MLSMAIRVTTAVTLTPKYRANEMRSELLNDFLSSASCLI